MRQPSLLLVLLSLAAPHLRAAPRATPAPAAPPAAIPVAVPAASGNSGNTSILRAGDAFEMKLTGMDPSVISDIANLAYTVGSDGTVNIPLIGKMRAGGLNSTQLEDAIQAKFIADKIFTKPIVIINPRQTEQQQRTVTVSGGVRQPGRQLWTADLTLGSAIGNDAGLNEFTSGKGIRIIRDGKVLGTYNYKEILKDPAKDVKLLPSDQVIVPE